MSKNKYVLFGVVAIAIILVVGLLFFFGDKEVKDGPTVELMDLYCEIVPYEGMSYGDKYVANEIFDSLLVIKDYSISNGLIKEYSINGNIITFTLNKSSFKTPSGEVELTNEYIVGYFDKLIRLAESDMLTNPGILNIQDVTEEDGKVKIEFISEKAYNILALTESIGYEEDAKWYGTKAEIEYGEGIVSVIKDNVRTSYVTSAATPGLENDMRIASMVLTNVLKDDTVKTEVKLNNSYGFLTWGMSGVNKFGKETREMIFEVLENVGIREAVTYGVNGIYDGTSLHKKLEKNASSTIEALAKAGISVKESLKIGVVNMGSFDEVSNAINQAFVDAKIPVYVETVELSDIVSDESLDLVYVRLERGLSPDISGLLSERGFIGKLGYHDVYKEDLQAINNAKTWEEMCSLLSELDYKMRDDGVWLFIDRGYDLITTKK